MANVKTESMRESYFKDDQSTAITIPRLAPTTETVQVKVGIFKRPRETVEINHDIKWGIMNKMVEQIFRDIIPDTRKQSKIVTKDLR